MELFGVGLAGAMFAIILLAILTDVNEKYRISISRDFLEWMRANHRVEFHLILMRYEKLKTGESLTHYIAHTNNTFIKHWKEKFYEEAY